MYRETADDLAKKYLNTFVMLRNKLFYCDGFGATSSDEIWADGTGPDGLLIRVSNISASDFRPVPVNLGYFNVVDESLLSMWTAHNAPPMRAWYLSRMPKRSPQVGMSHHTHWLSSVVYHIVRGHISIPKLELDRQVILDNLKAWFPTLSEAFEFLKHSGSIAWSSDYIISNSVDNNPHPLLGHRFGFIGRFTTPTTLEIHHKASFQEVLDFVMRTRQPVRVLQAG